MKDEHRAAGAEHIAPGEPPRPATGVTAEPTPDHPPGFERDETGERLAPEAPDIALALAPGWSMVRIGLGLMFWGVLTLLITFLIYLGAAFVMMVGGVVSGFHVGGAGALLLVVLAVAFAASVIVIVVGQCFCVAAPPESDAKGLAIASMVCLLLSIALSLGLLALIWGMVFAGVHGAAFGLAQTEGGAFLLVAFLGDAGVAVIGHVLFVRFLRGVALHFRNQSLAATAGSYIVIYLVVIAIYAVLSCIAGLGGPGILGCLGFLVLVVGIAIVFELLRLIHATRATIAAPLTGRG